MREVVNLDEVFASFEDRWSPRIVAAINDYDVKIVHVAGEFVWHDHADTDEFFLVLAGRLVIDLDHPALPSQVELTPGEVYVVPRGVAHRPVADEGTRLLLLEPRGTVNTGDSEADGTAGLPVTD
jgi:mannose-6-phosphate isomerase-like protein (cupin superfamily)